MSASVHAPQCESVLFIPNSHYEGLDDGKRYTLQRRIDTHDTLLYSGGSHGKQPIALHRTLEHCWKEEHESLYFIGEDQLMRASVASPSPNPFVFWRLYKRQEDSNELWVLVGGGPAFLSG